MSTALEAFVSGRRGQLAVHSKDLADWLGIDNDRVAGLLMIKTSVRPASWFIGNCWNQSCSYKLNHDNGTFQTIYSYWISESVAMLVCRSFRKDRLPDLRRVFARARERDIESQTFITSGSNATNLESLEVSA